MFNLGDKFVNDRGEYGTITDVHWSVHPITKASFHYYDIKMDDGLIGSISGEYADKNYLEVRTIPNNSPLLDFIPFKIEISEGSKCVCETLLNGHLDECPYPKRKVV